MRLLDEMTRRVGCMRAMRVLQSYLDADLDEVAARRVAGHLEECRRCGLELAVYSEIKGALRRKERSVKPPTLDRLQSFAELLATEGLSGDVGDSGA